MIDKEQCEDMALGCFAGNNKRLTQQQLVERISDDPCFDERATLSAIIAAMVQHEWVIAHPDGTFTRSINCGNA